jgi:hypothetical protein
MPPILVTIEGSRAVLSSHVVLQNAGMYYARLLQIQNIVLLP